MADDIDYDVLPDLLGYHLRRAQVSVFGGFSQAIAGQNLTPGQFGVLVLIGANAGLSQSALARAVGIERSTMVAAIDGLESRGLVERRPSTVDRRSNALVLSAKGKSLVNKAKARVKAHEDEAFGMLDAAERATLMDLLYRVWRGPAGT
ncbi:MAG: MarR family transcriptional regulator [Rhodobacterales bacterium]|nr:MarR family transcriptional regulator [Rhodobacterales bacterium]